MNDKPQNMPIAIGTETEWGKIEAVGTITGERYYWTVDGDGTVSMMPATMVETKQQEEEKR